MNFVEKQKFTMNDVEANANWWTKHMTPLTTDTTDLSYDEKLVELLKYRIRSNYGTWSNYGTPCYFGLQMCKFIW